MHRTGTTPEQMALVSVKNHGNALKNPLAQLPMKITVNDVLKSEMIADPLHKLDCSPVSDGCAAVIIAHESVATKFKQKPVWIKGVSFCADSFFFGDRDLSRARSLTEAAKKAYAMAGIKDPKKEIDVAEVYDAFTYQELMWLEEMGLADDATAGKLLEKGEYNMDGRLPVNASGRAPVRAPRHRRRPLQHGRGREADAGRRGRLPGEEGEDRPGPRRERPRRPVALRVDS